MIAQAAGLALLAALSPTALLVAAVYLGSARPRLTSLFYLAGAVAMSLVMGVVILVALRSSGLNHPDQHAPRYGLRLGLGFLRLGAGFVFPAAGGRNVRRGRQAAAARSGETAARPRVQDGRRTGAAERVRRWPPGVRPGRHIPRRAAGDSDGTDQPRARGDRRDRRRHHQCPARVAAHRCAPGCPRADRTPPQGLQRVVAGAREPRAHRGACRRWSDHGLRWRLRAGGRGMTLAMPKSLPRPDRKGSGSPAADDRSEESRVG